MRIFPAVHYTMGGLWVDYCLMSNLPGLHVLGEANFSDHGANRLGASALMQGLADGYFVLPYTIPTYLATLKGQKHDTTHRAFVRAEAATKDKLDKMLSIRASVSVTSFHRELGLLMWDKCGMARNEAGLKEALEKIPKLREEFWRNVNVPGGGDSLNQSLELARAGGGFSGVRRVDVPRRVGPVGVPAAGISARKARPTKARRCATTRILPTSPPGNTRAKTSRRRCTRNPSTSRRFISRNVPTNDQPSSPPCPS